MACWSRREPQAHQPTASVWIDLLNPTKEEDLQVEKALGIAVPTREEMAEIEASSRLYQEGGGALHDGRRAAPAGSARSSRRSARPSPSSWPATGSSRCATRSRAPFRSSSPRAQKKDAACMTGAAVMVGLLEAIIDREADRVERIQAEVDKLSQSIFGVQGRRAHAHAALRRDASG